MTNDHPFPTPPELVHLPIPPATAQYTAREELALYARFMRYLRHVPHGRMEIKILSAIQFTADMADVSDAQVAKLLVDLGLRAPRLAFPADFLKFADESLLRGLNTHQSAGTSLRALKDHWDAIGEDRLAPYRGGFDYAVARVDV